MSYALVSRGYPLVPVVLPPILVSVVILLLLAWPAGFILLAFGCLIPLALLVEYRRVYLVWLFTLPFLRNFINVRTPFSDIKPSYVLMFVAVAGWVHASRRRKTLGLPMGKAFKLLYLALALLVTVTMVSVVVSSSPAEGLRAIPKVLYVVAVVLVTAHILDSREACLRAVKVCSMSLAAAVALGFLFYATSVLPGGYVIDLNAGWPPKVMTVDQDLGQEYELGDQASFVHRYSAGFGNLYDTTGDFALVGGFLFLGWMGERTRPMGRPWLWCWIILFAIALLLTYSRGAWLCAALGLLVLIVLPRGQWRQRLAILAAMILVVWLSPKTVAERVMTPDASIYSRGARVLFSLDIIRSHPIFGVGPGVFTDLLTSAQGNWQQLGIDADTAVSAHSAFLQYTGEQGLLGLAALSFFFSIYFIAGLRLLRSAPDKFREQALAGAIFVAFLTFCIHCFILPGFEDLLWAVYSIGFVMAIHATVSVPRIDEGVHP